MASTSSPSDYVGAKARVVRAINRVATFARASIEFNNDCLNIDKRAKIKRMLTELNEIRRCVEADIQIMETTVGNNTAPNEVLDNSASNSLIDSFDSLYYDLAAFADINQMSLSTSDITESQTSCTNQSTNITNSYIHYPQRKFPSFSGCMKEWQTFEQLFKSILSHTPEMPEVEKFEILKTSLEGEARTLIAHLSLTAANYRSAWDILQARYGNKRDLARIHIEPLIASYVVKSNDATSIKNLLNCILEHTAALDNLDFVTRQWSPILIHIFEKHLDRDLRTRWELVVGEQHCPKLNDFVDFLRRQIRSADIHSSIPLSITQTNVSNKFNQKSSHAQTFKSRGVSSAKVFSTTANQSSVVNCPMCHNLHSIRKCPIFIDKPPNERFQIAKAHRLCINCLGPGHSSITCPSKNKCQTCNRSHHSLLHFNTTVNPSISITTPPVTETLNTASCIIRGSPKQVVLLSTVLLDVCAADGSHHCLRALIDSGSQASFITEKSACTLMLRRCHSSVNITTFASNATTRIHGKSTINITPRGQQTPSLCVDTYIVPQITGLTPQTPIVHGKWAHIQNLSLADPSYHIPRPIDLLLGADILPLLLLDGKISGGIGEPIAIETIFGWILMGPVNNYDQSIVSSLCLSVSDDLDVTIKQFWEMEELPSIRHFSPDDEAAEKIYQTTTTRLSSGRFMVTIPFRTPSPLLGDSKTLALRRYKALELRLNKDNDLRQQYLNFMQDYLTAGHMELVPLAEINNIYTYYIPHHCVIRPGSTTTKLRVVFNASARTSTGLSLNESMYTGPKLQPNIQIVLLRGRLWKYLFMADIKQMYRQILVRPADRDYLRILWRFNQSDPIQEYRLCTVTYGTSAAPYQALRTIRELATTDGSYYPFAAAILQNDTFVDDILTGANSEEDVLEYQSQLIKLCAHAKFELRKWASNNIQILQAVPEDGRAMSPSVLFDTSEQSELNVLGLKWNPVTDTLSFNTQSLSNNPTKRSVLSDIARVFDPLGLLSPVTFWTKHIMQQLWTAGLMWDDQLPPDIGVLWARYQTELKLIENISIPRRITYSNALSIQLHVFADSSAKGYAAAVYLRIQTSTSFHCQLVTGKSKVAPLKRSTIPRLELCGAVLAAKLLRLIADTYSDRLKIDKLFAWTDSTTVLSWIRSSPSRWATFVANRTSQIHELTSPSIWRHVPTQHNPVDCASRGIFPSELLHHPLWWTGPAFLLEPPDKWPSLILTSQDNELILSTEERKPTILLINTQTSMVNILDRFSSLNKILRIIAYCLRLSNSRPSTPLTKIISANEMERAVSALVYFVQQITYPDEISRLLKGLCCSKNLRRLDPFIDENGLIRVGGRLKNADLPYAHKHPLLLPSRHRFTDLLIDYHHQRLKHPGATALQTYLQRDFWIQSIRQAIRSRLRLCIACFRTRPQNIQPKMGDLPKFRVQQIKPFAITGVDYAGPITIKESRGRRSFPTSAYICLFVCTNTKAIHLELSSDLSTEKFLLAFTRFAARRGPIKEMHSDCGTNFIGASRLLNPLLEFTNSQSFQDSVYSHLSKQHIGWYFNPPASPHFGGLWEAGVKSTKSLLLRSIGTHKLTYEELNTLLTQIEATLNSRPLCALSDDPTDLEPLTPSHFLTMEPVTTLPEPSLKNIPLSRMQRWRLITDLHRHFWSRWKNEYLSSLQLRQKWSHDGKQLKINDLVLLKEASHPLHWRLGRVRSLHPGSDGIIRVATVDTSTGTLTRPAVKLCPLPIA